MATIKCFDKATLKRASHIAKKRKYNRNVLPSFLKSLPEDKWFPVVFSMMHEHAQGQQVAAHIRCWVEYDTMGNRFFIDCDMNIYKNLQSFEVPDKKEAK
jgi:hypothetical protein